MDAMQIMRAMARISEINATLVKLDADAKEADRKFKEATSSQDRAKAAGPFYDKLYWTPKLVEERKALRAMLSEAA